jgi:phosphotriesterase-related protein
VNTVAGPVDCTRLGLTLSHEHIIVTNPELEENYPPAAWDEDAVVAQARDDLNAAYASGVRTLVDLTVLGLGRSIEKVRRIADRLPLNVVVATGYYAKTALPSYFQMRRAGGMLGDTDPLPEMFITEIEDGIAGTGVRAGVIKVLTDAEGETPDVRRVLEAAAAAQLKTGVPVFTHTHAPSRTGEIQQRRLGELGVDLGRVLIGHCDGATDLGYLKALMDAGSTIGIDQFGLLTGFTDEQRIDKVLALCQAGYSGKIVLSHDANSFTVNIDNKTKSERYPMWRQTAMTEWVVPALLSRGLDHGAVDQMLVANPARLLARHGAGGQEA